MEKELILNLFNRIPDFKTKFDLDDDDPLYIVFGGLGTYIEELHNSKYKIVKYNIKSATIKNDQDILNIIFNYLSEIFNNDDQEIHNLINVSVWEVIPTLKHGYVIAKDFMSDLIYSEFLKNYPYENHKNDWDNENYYSEEELRRIFEPDSADL